MIQHINRHQSRQRQQRGFTLVELLLSIAFIGFLLLFIVFAMVQVMGNYSKGLAVKSINQTARGIVEEMTRLARSTNAEAIRTSKVGNGRLCFGGVSYMWNIRGDTTNKDSNNKPLTLARVEDPTMCDDSLPPAPVSKVVSLTTDQIWVQEVEATLSASNKLLTLSLRLSTSGDNQPTNLSPDGYVCVGGISGNYCAVAEFTTTVSTRNGGQ